jgi:RNA polymerase sigma-70 factor (ECF subfamily)
LNFGRFSKVFVAVTQADLSDDSRRLVEGGSNALPELFSRYRERLERMVEFRLDPRIRMRIDPADILQDAYLEIARRLKDYASAPRVSCFVWMRQQTMQVMIDSQRRQFREKRNPLREVTAGYQQSAEGTSIAIARYLIADMTSPSQAAEKAEEWERVKTALQSMNEIDREVLALRHFEMLDNREVAEILGLSITAASNRYVRAAARLGEILRK